MHERLSRTLTRWKLTIFEVGIFLLFVFEFGDYLIRKLWGIVGPLFR